MRFWCAFDAVFEFLPKNEQNLGDFHENQPTKRCTFDALLMRFWCAFGAFDALLMRF